MDRTNQELIATLLAGEMDRYWTRFNIFAVVQVGAIIGILTEINFLLLNTMVFRCVLLILLLFSITGAIAIFRGHDLQRSFVLTLKDIEKTLPKDQQLLEAILSHMRMPTFISNYTCSAFGVLCCILWVIAWIWLEVNKFSGLSIPKTP